MRHTILRGWKLAVCASIAALQCSGLAHGREERGRSETDVYQRSHEYRVTEEERRLLVWNAYHEARGEGALGIAAVTHVILNRVRNDHFPHSIVAVITEGGKRRDRCQFSWYCDGHPDEPKDLRQLQEVQAVVEKVLSGGIKDATIGAVFYLNPFEVVKRRGKLPDTACDTTLTISIGNHFFYGLLPWKEYKEKCENKPKFIESYIAMM